MTFAAPLSRNDMDAILDKKREARAIFREKRRSLDPKKKAFLDEALCQRLISCEAYASADVILAYYPIKNEPDVLPIVRDALSRGKRVAFPISDTEGFELDFRFVRSLDDMVCGSYAIPEPTTDAEGFSSGESSKALCIVPGLAFDRDGFRIGYGKGFYDRFLSGFGGVSVGLLYEEFLTERLPREKTDAAVDIIMTEKEEILTHGKRE